VKLAIEKMMPHEDKGKTLSISPQNTLPEEEYKRKECKVFSFP